MKKLRYPFIFLLCSSTLLSQELNCIYCPQNLTDNGVISNPVEVINSGPDELINNPLQKVCINISHTWIGDLAVSLTAPDGTTYLLMADVNNFPGGCGLNADDVDVCFELGTNNALTNNTEYLCNDTSPCLTGNWTVACGNVTSSIGGQAPNCNLYDFSTTGGSVSGIWQLNVSDICGQDVGTLNNWSLEFLDNTDISLNTGCDADGGIYPNDSLVACTGSVEIVQHLTPSYTSTPPSSLLYDYAYVVFSGDHIFSGILDEGGLLSLADGSYEICGLSFLKFDSTFLPDPDTTLTLDEIIANIETQDTNLCRSLSDTCTKVTLMARPSLTVTDPYEICTETFDLIEIEFEVYHPNPNNDSVTISFHDHLAAAESGDHALIDWIEYYPGIYFIRAAYDNGCYNVAELNVREFDTVAIHDPNPVFSAEEINLETVSYNSFGVSIAMITYHLTEQSALDGMLFINPIVNESGTYWIRFESVHGCIVVESVEVVIHPVGISIPWTNSLKVYPNPAIDYLFIEKNVDMDEVNIRIYSPIGHLLKKQHSY